MGQSRRQRQQFIDLIHAFYNMEGDFEAWALNIINAARPHLDDGGGLGLRVIDTSSPWQAKLVSVVWPGDPQALERWAMLGRLVPPGWVHALYRVGVDVFLESERVSALFRQEAFEAVLKIFSGPTTLAQWRAGQSLFWKAANTLTRSDAQNAAFALNPPSRDNINNADYADYADHASAPDSPDPDPGRASSAGAADLAEDRPILIAAQPAADLMMVNVCDIDRQVLSLTASQQEQHPLSRSTRQRLQRAGEHMLIAWRMRRDLSRHAPEAQTARARGEALLHTSEVVWDADSGRLLHVQNPDRAPLPPSGPDPRARSAWLAIQQGRWAAIQVLDTDSRRFIVARDLGVLGDPRALSGREHQVLIGVCAGLSNRQVAQRLGLSVSTISAHLSSLMHKLGIERRADLIGQSLPIRSNPS